MKTLELTAVTDGHQTNSKDIQEALSQVGENEDCEALHLQPGNYYIDDSIPKTCDYSLFGINSGTSIFGDLDANGSPLAKLQLMANFPIKKDGKTLLGCDVAIFGPSDKVGNDISLYNFAYDGNCILGGGRQKIIGATTCPGNHVQTTQETGKSFHNFFSAVRKSITNFEMSNFVISNTAGDILRTSQYAKSSGIFISDGTIMYPGHCALMVEATEDVIIRNCKVMTRGNGGFRSQNGCSDITIDGLWVIGTTDNYNPGMQITGQDITIKNSLIHDTMGPGIDIVGDGKTDVTVLNSTFINCGTFATGKGDYNVAAIAMSEANVTVEDSLFYGNYQNSIANNNYQPNKKTVTMKGFTLTTRNNKIINTQKSKYSVSGNGKHLGNMLSGHTLISERNSFYPLTNYSYGPIIWVDSTPEEVPELVEGFDVEGQ